LNKYEREVKEIYPDATLLKDIHEYREPSLNCLKYIIVKSCLLGDISEFDWTDINFCEKYNIQNLAFLGEFSSTIDAAWKSAYDAVLENIEHRMEQ
jgi:hypothetical protein